MDSATPVDFHPEVERVVVSNPDIATVSETEGEFYIIGRDVGATNLLIYGKQGKLLEILDLHVGYDSGLLSQKLALALPGEAIDVRDLNNRILLLGEASTPQAAAIATAMAEKLAPRAVTSAITVRSSEQVIFDVHVVEAGREVLKSAGVDLNIRSAGQLELNSGSGLLGPSAPFAETTVVIAAGDYRGDSRLRMLEEKGLARILARSSVAAASGEKAHLHAGGEFPFPVPSGKGDVTLQFMPYGVSVDFKPTINPDGLIRLQMNSEISGVDVRNGLRQESWVIPALSIRQTNTTVELSDGDTLVVGGLYQRGSFAQRRDIPVLGRIPILGAALSSMLHRHQEMEVTMLVTARLASSADRPTADEVPADVPQIASREPELPVLAQAPPATEVLDAPPRTRLGLVSGPIDTALKLVRGMRRVIGSALS